MAKSFLVFSVLLASIGGTFAQENCDLSSKNAALLLNLKIGMTPDAAQNVFGKDLKIKVRKNGERTIFQNYIKTPAPDRLSGVRAIYLRFFDKKLYQLEIFYEPRPGLATIKEISEALAAQLNFPAAQWQIKFDRAELRCNNLALLADNVLNPRIQMTDEIIRAEIAEARRKK